MTRLNTDKIAKRVMSKVYAWKYPLLAVAVIFSMWNLLVFSRPKDESPGIAHLDQSKLRDFFTKLHHRHDKLKSVSARSRIYEEIFTETTLYDLLEKHTLHERCMVYFNHLYISDPDWMVNPVQDIQFNRDAYRSYDDWRKGEMDDIGRKKEEAEKKGEKYTPPTEAETRKKYDEMRGRVLDDEQTLHDYVAHVRIFDKCFMGSAATGSTTDDLAFVKKQRRFLKKKIQYLKTAADQITGKVFKNELQCSEVEDKIFPWFTNQYPLFTRWDGKVSFFPGMSGRLPSKRSCFLSEYKSRLNGKGIVMTLSDEHVPVATRFLRLLRYLGNTYPIQVVYHSNLSEEARNNLVRGARDHFRNFPAQDIWFVNAERSIHEEYRHKFDGFANKIAATMFNSFEHALLCDADAVLLESPEYFFKLKKFVEKGTIFYKDRASGQYRGDDDIVLFKKLMPSIEDSVIFNVAQNTNFTLENEFFLGFSHYMESGVVAMDRSRHFMQPVMMSILNFYRPISSRLYGDKELFWLALSLAGDEDYAFNNHFAAAIGEFTPESERHKDIGERRHLRSREICSNHPAHISDHDDQTLLWFNSGFRHCGNSMKPQLKWNDEFRDKRRYSRIKTLDEFKTFFKAPLVIKNAVLPPYPRENKLMRNVEHEPDRPWVMGHYCYNYLWCAYSSIGGYYEENGETKDSSMTGTIITFSEKEQEKFEKAGDVWIQDFDWAQHDD